MAKKIEKELEQAIILMNAKEKDKLLIRLISKDKILVEKLQYKLLEDPIIDLKIRKEETLEEIAYYSDLPFLNRKEVLKELRIANSKINHFKKITADKLGEIELTLSMITSFLENHLFIQTLSFFDIHTENIRDFLCKKLNASIGLIDKLHEDYKIEFHEKVNAIIYIFFHSELKSNALNLSIPQEFEI